MQPTAVCCQLFQHKTARLMKKSAALSNSGVSQWLKLTCRPTEHFSAEYKLNAKSGSTFVLMEGN